MEEAEHYAYPEHWSQALQWIYSKQGNVRGALMIRMLLLI